MKHRFPVLRFFAQLQILLGVILLLISGFGFWFVMTKTPMNSPIIGYEWAVVAALFMSGIGSIAYGQFLEVVMQIEENTRPLPQVPKAEKIVENKSK